MEATVQRFAAMPLEALEHIWRTRACAPLPGGVWQGHYLRELPMSLPKRLLSRAMFKRRMFGLDLNYNRWWFRDNSRLLAHFEPHVGRSRWRDTEVVQVRYERTGPALLKGMLYDELKPLDDRTILGLGGSKRGGAWFYFVMTPVPVL